jgi:hypothetical protein
MITQAAPLLLSHGFSLQKINNYFWGNPRRFFEAFEKQ